MEYCYQRTFGTVIIARRVTYVWVDTFAGPYNTFVDYSCQSCRSSKRYKVCSTVLYWYSTSSTASARGYPPHFPANQTMRISTRSTVLCKLHGSNTPLPRLNTGCRIWKKTSKKIVGSRFSQAVALRGSNVLKGSYLQELSIRCFCAVPYQRSQGSQGSKGYQGYQAFVPPQSY